MFLFIPQLPASSQCIERSKITYAGDCLRMAGSMGAAAQSKLSIRLSLDSSRHIGRDSLHVVMTLSNVSKKTIKIPGELWLGLNKDPVTGFILQMEKKVNGKFSKENVPDNYFPPYIDPTLIDLPAHRSITDTYDIAFFYGYRIPPGRYRLRFQYQKTVYSNWVYVNI